MTEMKVEYVVKAVDRYPHKKGYVAVLLSPREAIMPDDSTNPIKIKNVGSNIIPEEAMQMIEMDVKSMFQRPRDDNDCAEIIMLFTETDYFALEWGYGDIISGSFKKIRDGKSINPFEEKCQR